MEEIHIWKKYPKTKWEFQTVLIITCQGSRCPSIWLFPCTSSCPYYRCSAQQSPPVLMTFFSNPAEPPCLAGGLHESCSRPNASSVCSPCSGPSTISRCEPTVGCWVTAAGNNNHYTCCITLISWEVINMKCMHTRIVYKHPMTITHRGLGDGRHLVRRSWRCSEWWSERLGDTLPWIRRVALDSRHPQATLQGVLRGMSWKRAGYMRLTGSTVCIAVIKHS